MSETPEGLQKTLTAFENYCNNWKLKVHTCKTKVAVLCKRRFRSNFIFKIYGQPIEVQDSYSYLGVTFNYNGNFNTARKKLLDQAQNSLYGLFRKIPNISIPIDLQLKLFDSLVTPILLYSAEV